jgi:chromosomal replication initiation ATPase DnaA
MRRKTDRQGTATMTNEDRRLMVETLAEMKELKGEMREFKVNVIDRVEKLENKEGERSKERLSVFSILIAGAALVVTIIINFFRNGGR